MNYRIDSTSKLAAYIQLYSLIRADIISGVYKYGDRLPSKRILAEETGLSVITTEHALEVLCEEGYAEARPRSGCFVIYRSADFQGNPTPPSNVMPGHGSVDNPRGTAEDDMKRQLLSDGSRAEQNPDNSESFPFSILARTMRKVILDYDGEILIKSPNKGCIELRNEIRDYLGRSRGIKVASEQIIIGAGAEYLYSLAAQLVSSAGAGTLIAVENPSYGKIRQVYQAMGMACDMLNLGANGIDSSALEKTRANVLHVTPFNSYPSGITADASKKHEYLRWAKNRGGYIIEDNYDSELTVAHKSEDSLFAMGKELEGADNVIYINTFSRTIAPSMRMGYMLIPDSLVKQFDGKLGFYSCTVPSFEQYVLARLLRSGDYERHINTVRRARRKRE